MLSNGEDRSGDLSRAYPASRTAKMNEATKSESAQSCRHKTERINSRGKSSANPATIFAHPQAHPMVTNNRQGREYPPNPAQTANKPAWQLPSDQNSWREMTKPCEPCGSCSRSTDHATMSTSTVATRSNPIRSRAGVIRSIMTSHPWAGNTPETANSVRDHISRVLADSPGRRPGLPQSTPPHSCP